MSPAGRPARAGRDLVVVSLEAWDEVWRRNQYLVSGLLDRDPALRVLFVEPPADPAFAARRGRPPRPGRGLRRGPGDDGRAGRLWLHEPTKLWPRRLDRRADDRLAGSVRRAATRAGIADPVLWVNDPAAAGLLAATGWPALYDVTDDWLLAPRGPAEHARLAAAEAVLLDACAEVVVCSPALARSKGAARPVTLVTNGVDVARYRRPRPRPDDLPAGPVALYLGTVHPDRFDVGLALRTARATAGAGTLVLAGPVVDLDRSATAALEQAGVRLLGARHRDDVPAYLQHADVLVVPHVVSPFTESLDPIKLYEYRAVGRPVVSTPVAGFRDAAGPGVVIAAADAFPAAVRDALTRSDGSGRAGSPDAGADAGPAAGIPTWAGQAALMGDVVDRVARRPARLR